MLNFLIAFGFFLVAFPLFWCGIVLLISRLGGWGQLAQHYAYSGDMKGEIKKRRSLSLVRFRLFPSNYSFIIKIGADTEALYISISKMFFAGHADLRIPLRDLTLEHKRQGLMTMGRLHTSKVPGVLIALRPNDVAWIESVTGPLPLHK